MWLGWALAGLAAVGWYKYAPSPEEDNYVKRFIEHYFRTPRETWERLNLKHLTLEAQASQETLIVADARKPDAIYTMVEVRRRRRSARWSRNCPWSPHGAGAQQPKLHVVDYCH